MLDVIFGTLLAWVLVRYRFPGRRLMDAVIDLPPALPTAVAGLEPELEEFSVAEATAIAVVLLVASLLALGSISWLESRRQTDAR